MTTVVHTPQVRTSRGRRTGAALTLACLLVPAGAAAAAPQAVTDDRPGRYDTVEYAPSAEVIANPERGFYRHTETHFREDGSGYTPLDLQTLRGYRDQGFTQILRVFYLEKFTDTPTLDAEWLARVEADFATAQEAGVSVIVRFAYAQGGAWPYSPPYGDAPVEIVLEHIDQLGPVLRKNSDVIATVQAGFIGLWGEWYYTDHFVADPADPGVVTEEDWQNREAVVRALLDELPDDRTVQVRTMLMKQTFFGVSSGEGGALTDDQAYDGSDVARVGHHNDCFLASPDDFGTFLSNPLELDEEYLAADTRFVPMGGETCTVNPPKSEWESASALMARYHFSYLNRDYNQDVLSSWGAEGLKETAKRLGYRFVMEDSTVTRGGAQDANAPTIRVDVTNEGWAAPYNERPARLVLQNERSTWAVPFVAQTPTATGTPGEPADARHWAPGTTTTISALACDVPAGRYDAYLQLPSADRSLQDNPDYSVRTANEGTWMAETGWNDLQRQVVVNGAGPDECGDLGAVRLDHADQLTGVVSVRTALEAYVTGGEVEGPIVQQLTNALRQAETHIAGDRPRPAAAALGRALARLEQPKAVDHLTGTARTVLTNAVRDALDDLG